MISDNNSLVVGHVLDRLSLSPLVDEVLTNPARVADGADGGGELVVVEPHHVQERITHKAFFSLMAFNAIKLCRAAIFIWECQVCWQIGLHPSIAMLCHRQAQ